MTTLMKHMSTAVNLKKDLDCFTDIWNQQEQSSTNGIEVVHLETENPHDQDTLGFRLSGSRSAGVFVKSIHCGSPADLVGKIHAGDQLLQVDEISLAGLTTDQVVRILRAALAFNGRVKVTIAHPWADRLTIRSRLPSAITPSRSDGCLSRHPVQSATFVQKQKSLGQHHTSTLVAEIHLDAELHSAYNIVRDNNTNAEQQLNDFFGEVDGERFSEKLFVPADIDCAENFSQQIAVVPRLNSNRKSATHHKHTFQAAHSHEGTLNVPDHQSEQFRSIKSKSFGPEDVKQMIINVPRKSFRKQLSTEELPLVSFDQLSQKTPSPPETRRTERGESSQSKSSKGSDNSNQSSQSHQLSWHCPVCLDGLTRIRKTKRRMMSTVCGHVFCSRCLEDVMNKYRMCPTCRTILSSLNEVHPIFM